MKNFYLYYNLNDNIATFVSLEKQFNSELAADCYCKTIQAKNYERALEKAHKYIETINNNLRLQTTIEQRRIKRLVDSFFESENNTFDEFLMKTNYDF